MLINILIGCGLIVLTVFIHATTMVWMIRVLKRLHTERWVEKSGIRRGTTVAVVVVTMFIAALIEATLWALTYVALGAISGFEKALYFSMVTFTTLGFGDVTLEEHWRLLSSFEAANGIIMFGWTTALIFVTVQRVYDPRAYAREKSDV